MNILNALSSQLLAELVVQLILLALPLTALFLAARSRRMARVALKVDRVRRRIVEEAKRNGGREEDADELSASEAVDATRPPAREIAPAWSPDSSRLAWGTVRDNDVELYVVDVVMGSIVRLTRSLEE